MARPDAARRRSARRFEMCNAFWDGGTARRLRRTDSLAWLAMWRHAQPDRSVTISAGRLAEMLGIGRPSAVRALRSLRDAGLILRVRRGGRDGTASTYRMRASNPDEAAADWTPL